MPRQVITKQVTIAGSGYGQPARTLHVGEVVELSSAELTAYTTAGGTARTTTARDTLGESAAAANSD
jgi:hypothetical protein